MAFGDDAVLTAARASNGKSMQLRVDATGLTSVTAYRVEGTVETLVRGAEDVPNTGLDFWVYGDYEVAQGAAPEYKAIISNGVINVEVGPVSPTGGAVDYAGDWLMPTGKPSAGRNVIIEAGGLPQLERSIQQDIQPVLNRESPVVVTYNRRFFTAEMSVLTLSDTERDDLLTILSYPVLLFVARTGAGIAEPLYLSPGTAVEERPSPLHNETARRHIISFTQVDRPPASWPYIPVGDTWQERYDLQETWTTVNSSYGNWSEYAGFPQ